jgi:ankyrin repeat protein
MTIRKTVFLFLLIFLPVFIYAGGQTDSTIDIEAVVSKDTMHDIKTILSQHESLLYHVSAEKKDSLLMTALKAGRDKNIIELLLKMGIDPDTINTEGQTALMYACQFSDDPDIARMILLSGTVFGFQRKQRVLASDKNKKTAFDYAAKNLQMMSMLSEYAKPPEKNPPTQTGAESSGQEQPQGKPVLSSEEKTNEQQSSRSADIVPALPTVTDTAVSGAVPESSPGDQPVYLFDYTAQTDMIPESQENIQEKNDKDFILYALSADKDGYTPLMDAAKKSDTGKITELLNAGTHINAQDHDGWNALMYAARFSNDESTVTLLISKGADVKIANKYGITPLLMAAAFTSNPDIITQLVANRNPAENEIRNAFIISITSQRPVSVIHAFLVKGLPLNQIYNGKTPLMYAAENNTDTKIISFFLESGASSDICTSEGKTAYGFASANSQLPHDSIYWQLNRNGGLIKH